MGKKKSIVLMVLLTIVIVVLCAITVVPSFAIPGTVKIWNPAVMQYDLGTDLGGGYYTYYYPTGVISETEYKNLEEEDKETSYLKHGGLYLNKDADLGIVTEDGEVSEDFKENFAKAAAEISARYEKKGYSDYRVAIVDDYALRVQAPASDVTEENSAFQNAYNTFGLFAETSEMEIKLGDSVVEERAEYEVNEIIKSFSVHTQYEVAYIKVEFTKVGREMVEAYRTSSDTTNTLKIMLGEDAVMEISATDHVTTRNIVKYPVANESEIGYVESMVILLNSVLDNGGFDIEFGTVSTSQVRTFEPVYGKNTMTLLFIALAVVLVALIALPIVKMGKFGVVNGYSIVSYLIVTCLCFAFITGGAFEVSLGTALVFVLGLVLMTVLNAQVYNAIKAEFALGKTVESSVKGGYRKTLWNVVDIYAVLLLGAVALLIGAAGLHTFALQAIICIVTGAFCNLLWTRVINYVFLSASKDKYKYFRFVREDDDDE